MIGCGDRGRTAHMQGIYKHLAATNFEIVALADPWRIHREQANGMVKEWFGREAKLFTSYRDLLAMDGIDAVMITQRIERTVCRLSLRFEVLPSMLSTSKARNS